MEVRDGFIIGIYNYCDRWCERCAFTGRCRVFADCVEREFELDHGPLAEPMSERKGREMAEALSKWEKKLGIDFDKVQEEVDRRIAAGEDVGPPEVRLEDLELETRAKELGFRSMEWLQRARRFARPEARDAVQVISHFAVFVPSKVYRALMGLADEGVEDLCSDANGSAKAALLGIDGVKEAWIQLVVAGEIDHATARPYLVELEFIGREVEKRFPRARAFVRAGFDEPDEVGRLEALERAGPAEKEKGPSF